MMMYCSRMLIKPSRGALVIYSPLCTVSPPKFVMNDETSKQILKTTTSAKHYFHHLQYVSRETNIKYLTKGALLKLYGLIDGPETGKYAIKMTNYYQKKGLDFTEQLAYSFVKASILGEQSKEAAAVCAEYSNRIGAWLTPKPISLLVDNLCEKNEVGLAVEVLATISVKGTICSPAVFEQLFPLVLANEEKASEYYKKLVRAADKMISKDDVASLQTKYPAPPTPVTIEVVDVEKVE